MTKLVPVNMSATAAARMAESEAPEAPRPEELCNWTQENRSVDIHAAAELGFPIGDLQGTANDQLLIFGSSKWADVEDKNHQHTYRYGVSVRVIVQASNLKAKGSITLPYVAASVEAAEARASAELIVRGFKGNLGQELPRWQSFGVEQYTQYMQSISAIQRKVMDAEPNALEPQLLATTAVAGVLPSSPNINATVHAIEAIAQGHDAADASRDQPPDAKSIIDTVYREYGIDGKPSPDDQDAARQQVRSWGMVSHLHRGQQILKLIHHH
jgi:hypothetical protein